MVGRVGGNLLEKASSAVAHFGNGRISSAGFSISYFRKVSFFEDVLLGLNNDKVQITF